MHRTFQGLYNLIALKMCCIFFFYNSSHIKPVWMKPTKRRRKNSWRCANQHEILFRLHTPIANCILSRIVRCGRGLDDSRIFIYNFSFVPHIFNSQCVLCKRQYGLMIWLMLEWRVCAVYSMSYLQIGSISFNMRYDIISSNPIYVWIRIRIQTIAYNIAFSTEFFFSSLCNTHRETHWCLHQLK